MPLPVMLSLIFWHFRLLIKARLIFIQIVIHNSKDISSYSNFIEQFMEVSKQICPKTAGAFEIQFTIMPK